jgi:hypothetical protein
MRLKQISMRAAQFRSSNFRDGHSVRLLPNAEAPANA